MTLLPKAINFFKGPELCPIQPLLPQKIAESQYSYLDPQPIAHAEPTRKLG